MVVFSNVMLVLEVYIWMIPKIVVPPNHPKLVYRVFHYKPSILGYPYFWSITTLGAVRWEFANLGDMVGRAPCGSESTRCAR